MNKKTAMSLILINLLIVSYSWADTKRGSNEEPAENCNTLYPPEVTSSQPPVPGNWKLSFEENFEGERLDGRKWKMGQHWAGINGIANNQPDNVSIECGYLKFSSKKQTTHLGKKTYQYTTGEITTFKRFRQLYGYYEARIRYSAFQGMWPVFWLMPDRGKYGLQDKNELSYLKFDLRSLKKTSVESAYLELVVEEASTGEQSVLLEMVPDNNWSESSITWQNRPVHDPIWIDRKYDPKWKTGDRVRFDITHAVNQALQQDKLLSIALSDTFMRAVRVSFYSKESSQAKQRPRLLISGEEEPVTVKEDATVRAGRYNRDNYGTDSSLGIYDDWGKTASTKDGAMEFDILESLGHWGPDTTKHALHWDGYGNRHKKTGSSHITIAPTKNGFHTYGMLWQAGYVAFYIDGKQTYEWKNKRAGDIAGYIILSLQMGGWKDDLGDGGVVDDASLPGIMLTDYVRVWKPLN